jgi:hypothetical protein
MLKGERYNKTGSEKLTDESTKTYDREKWKDALIAHDEKLQKKRGLINDETPEEGRRKMIGAFVILFAVLILLALIYPHIQVKMFRLVLLLIN